MFFGDLEGCKLRMTIQHSVWKSIFCWLRVSRTLNTDILALSSEVSIVDICWAHTAVGSYFSRLWGQASFAVVYIVSPFPEHWACVLELCVEFQKLFSSCMLLNKLGLFDRVTQASLVRVLTSYNRSVHLSMANSPLAPESRSTPLNNQSPSC